MSKSIKSSKIYTSKSRNLTYAVKNRIAGKQHYQCANRPDSNLKGLNGYHCPLWKLTEHRGIFDAACYDIDHIVEYSLTQNNNENSW